MSLLATSLKKPKAFSLKRRAIAPATETKRNKPSPPEPVLPSSDLPKFAKVRAKKKTEAYEELPPDLFDIGNETGQRLIDALYAAITGAQAQGVRLLPAMPTVTAYEVETEILNAIGEGSISEYRLQDLVARYIRTHSGDAIGAWTDKTVPLFYMTLTENGSVIEAYTANFVQVCLIRELWLRTSPEASFGLMPL